MGLSENQKNLIQAVSQNNIALAKKHAINCVNEDTTAKNNQFCRKYKLILETSAINMIELPYDLKNILCAENVSNSFKESRYFLSDRENEVFKNIITTKNVNEKLLELGVLYSNSVLLYGDSGTGKTSFGKYIAFKIGLPFYYLNFSNLIDSLMGGTSKNISKAFSYATSNPCVFMLDEIDCISIRRSTQSGGSSNAEMARLTITMMQEFDKLANDIIVIGATNRLDRIDEALLRRFSIKHEVQALNSEEKHEMIRKYLSDIKMDFPESEISELINNNENQSALLNKLIRMIVEKITNEVVENA